MPQTRHYEMKDSGVEWIGEMPSHWQYTPLKYLASCNDEVLTEATPEDYTFDYIDIGSVHTGNGIGICERMQFKDAPSRARRIVRDGDIIVSTVRIYLKAIAQVGNYDVPHIASTGFAVIRTKNANASFLKYALLSDNFVSQVEADSVGISYPAINASQIMTFKIPVPPLSEQTAIAAYLDEKCATIDAIITEAKATIEEYKSWKASVIFETVTKGLNPNAEMKDSGVEWIGEIPRGWNLMPFGKIASIKACLVPPKEYPLLPQISPDNIEKGSARLLQNYKTVQESGVISWNHHFYKGQIIYSKVRPTLNKLFLAQFEGLCSADMYPIETTQDARYLVYAMLSGYFVQQVAAITANRVKMPKINKQELSKITVLLPPLSEQASIVSYLDRKCSLIDGIILEKEELIKELEHYKRSLIFEVVTGKRRVC